MFGACRWGVPPFQPHTAALVLWGSRKAQGQRQQGSGDSLRASGDTRAAVAQACSAAVLSICLLPNPCQRAPETLVVATPAAAKACSLVRVIREPQPPTGVKTRVCTSYLTFCTHSSCGRYIPQHGLGSWYTSRLVDQSGTYNPYN